MPTRYAVYYVPAPDSALWRFGSEVLGYDAYTGETVPQWRPDDITAEDWHAMTADPRLYGYHATLKAPFRLNGGGDETRLAKSLEDFAAAHRPVDLGEWIVKAIASSRPDSAFLALVPAAPPEGLASLEGAVVRHFDALRAPLTQAEVAKRNPARLSERQRAYLDAHGYPYVLEEFRFHMTLTGPITKSGEVGSLLAERAKALNVAPRLNLDRLGLFRQEDGGRFRVLSIAMLG
ncbi:phosphonate metabolism protein [Labrys miyagiensis]